MVQENDSVKELTKDMGRKRIKPEKIEERIGSNPLAGVNFKILVRKILDTKHYKLEGEEMIPFEMEFEQDEYVKLYTKPENRKLISNCSDAAKRFLIWVIYNLETGKDYIWINKQMFMGEVGIKSVNTYKKAVSELVRYNAIQISLVKDVYWINPQLFFAGSRINKYPNNVKEYKPKQ